MKKIGVLAVLVVMSLLLVLPGSAQMKFGAGARFGMNFATSSVDPDFYTGYEQYVEKGGRTGLMFGGVATVEFAKMFEVALLPTYVQKGFKYETVSGYYFDEAKNNSLKYKVNELDLPVYFRVKFLHGPIRPYVFVGPNIGFVLSATESYSGGTDVDNDMKDKVSSVDFGLDFGGGAEYMVAPNIGLTCDALYSLGLSDMNNATAKAGETASTIKTRGFQVLIGTMFYF